MKKIISLKEYFLYIILKILLRISNIFPAPILVWQGKILGTLLYHLDRKHRKIAYKNLRMCLAPYKSISEIKSILKKNFQNFGMSLMEILIIPKINKEYIQRNIEIQGLEYLNETLKQKKGAILLGIHMGSWEICFAVAGVLGLPFYILAEKQRKFPLLDRFLNQLRMSKGIKVIYAGEARQAINILKGANILGLVFDHGIKEGLPLEFFGHISRIPTLAMRLALDTKVAVIPGYVIRKGLIKHKIVLLPPLKIRYTNNRKEDLIYNLKQTNRIFEACIKENPSDYLWFYKRFKYNQDRTVLFLEDDKAGHLRQLDALGKIIKDVAIKKGLLVKIERIKIDFKNKLSKNLQIMGVGLARKSQCRECLWCLKNFLNKESFLKISSTYADIVVSCGSSLAGVNFVVSSLNEAKSIVIMRPSILSTKRFDLVIAPFHDGLAFRKNTLVLDGALTYIDERTLEESKEKIKSLIKKDFPFYIGLLIGGDTKDFKLKKEIVLKVIEQIMRFCEENNCGVLLTTSRRTSKDIEILLKDNLENFSHLGILIIANEKNYPFAVEGILALSKFVVVSPESISMITEAVSAKRYVLVFKDKIFNRRHKLFLKHFLEKKYIYLVEPQGIERTIKEIILKSPPIPNLNDREKIAKAIEEIL